VAAVLLIGASGLFWLVGAAVGLGSREARRLQDGEPGGQ